MRLNATYRSPNRFVSKGEGAYLSILRRDVDISTSLPGLRVNSWDIAIPISSRFAGEAGGFWHVSESLNIPSGAHCRTALCALLWPTQSSSANSGTEAMEGAVQGRTALSRGERSIGEMAFHFAPEFFHGRDHACCGVQESNISRVRASGGMDCSFRSPNEMRYGMRSHRDGFDRGSNRFR